MAWRISDEMTKEREPGVGDTTVFLYGVRVGVRGVITKCEHSWDGVGMFVIKTALYGDYFSTRHGFEIVSCIFNKEGENG